jgi:S-adenosylmethionine-diacylglycerol 3-amino-3-carboxypropyl transferase
MSEFARSADLDTLRYGQVWEDHRLAEEGLAVGPGDDVVCIASAGCNVLHLLLREPRSITAVDLSAAQLAVVELKIAALAGLDHEDVVALFGYRSHPDRTALYERLRPGLSDRARAYWDAHPQVLAAGAVHAGRLETYFRGFQERSIVQLVGAEPLARFLALDDLAAQEQAFERLFATPAFESAFRAYYDRETMARQGRDPSQFAFVASMDVAGFFWSRFRWVCTALPARGNPYLEWFLTGAFGDLSRALGWLDPRNAGRLRALLPRVSLEQADVGSLVRGRAPGTFSKAALSDVFEYMSPEDSDALFEDLARGLRSGARLCYWNLLVPRSSPGRLRAHLRPDEARSEALWSRDRSWFYRAFRVEEAA